MRNQDCELPPLFDTNLKINELAQSFCSSHLASILLCTFSDLMIDDIEFSISCSKTSVWKLNTQIVPCKKWSILSHAKPYNPVTKVCRLCLKEASLNKKSASLNKKSEVFGWCKHRHQWTLSNTWGRKNFIFILASFLLLTSSNIV